MKKELTNLIESAGAVLESIEEIEQAATRAGSTIEKQVQPLRKNLIKRYPTVFLIVVAIGFVLTSFGAEAILLRYDFFSENPFLTLGLGFSLLLVTGAVYKIGQV